ncbi:MAG: hypothetical protein NVSMB23_20660 [Myxococcales bacterium]
MVNRKRGSPDRIGTTDPDSEPVPPRIDDAGALGEVGEHKLETVEDKSGIWGERPRTPDQDPRDPAARKPPAPGVPAPAAARSDPQPTD